MRKRVNWYVSDEFDMPLKNSNGSTAEKIIIDGSILESLVKAYNESLQWTQDHPQLEIYERDGKLYACEADLPHEPEFELELYGKLVATEIGVKQ